VVSIACWLALAAAVAWNVRRSGMRPVAFSLVLLFSLSVWITQWDSLILSESLAVSLAAAALAAWLALVRAPSPWTITGVFTVPFVLVWTALPGRRRGRVALAVGLLARTSAQQRGQRRLTGGAHHDLG